MVSHVAAPDLLLPWHPTSDEDRRFWRILGWCLIPLLLLSIGIPLVDTPEPKREELEKLPPQLARIVLEEKELPKPLPPPVEEPKPEEKPEEKVETVEPAPEPRPVEAVQQAREKASQSGVLQFADDLAEMRDSIDLSEVSSANITRNSIHDNGKAVRLDRALIASRAEARSGGIDTSALSRDTGGVALAGRETTRVESKLAVADATGAEAGSTPDSNQQTTRNNEAIRKVMDRNKQAIFAIYNRALRRDPTLEGRVVVKLVIAPSGAVSSADIVSSDLRNEDLEKRILMRIRMIDFGAENVGVATLNYTFDFLPS